MEIPANESQRLQALHRLEVLDTAPEETFDRITRLASRLLDCPIALVSLVDEHRQWFKSKVGLDADQTEREHAFCAHAIHGSDVFVVSDATADGRFSSNPLVVGEPKIRCYAGAPLVTAEQQRIGTLCVIDRVSRELSPEDQALLRDLAAIVVDELELRLHNIETKRQVRRLAAANEQHRLLGIRHDLALRASGIGVWDWNVTDDQLVWDERMFGLYGIQAADFGSDYEAWLSRLVGDDRATTDSLVQEALTQDREVDAEFAVLWPTGEVRNIRAVAAVIRDEQGAPLRMIGVSWDVTNERAREQKLRRTNEELEQFAYFASHDLQAPLRHVTSFVGLVEEQLGDGLDADTAKWMGYITQGTGRMKKLIEDLLAYSRAGRSTIVREDVPMAEVVRTVCDILNTGASTPALRVHSTALPTVHASRTQMEQLLQNLFQNAAKYAKPNVSPEVTVAAKETPTTWEFQVSDNGVGIPLEYQQEIFYPFRRFSEDRADSTGVGLAICTKIVERHGGQISVSSEEGEGASFTFSLSKAT